MSSSLIRQDLIPIVIGYALIMGALAIGLRIVRRSGPERGAEGARLPEPAHRPGPGGPAGRALAPAPAPAQEAELAGSRAAPGGAPAASPARRGLRAVIRPGPGWPRLILHYLATAVGGYLILMIVIILYYYLVAPVAGNFVQSAFTGCAMLIGLTLPVFLAASWLAERTGWRF
jgi:Family of unknown function (DUF6256)